MKEANNWDANVTAFGIMFSWFIFAEVAVTLCFTDTPRRYSHVSHASPSPANKQFRLSAS